MRLVHFLAVTALLIKAVRCDDRDMSTPEHPEQPEHSVDFETDGLGYGGLGYGAGLGYGGFGYPGLGIGLGFGGYGLGGYGLGYGGYGGSKKGAALAIPVAKAVAVPVAVAAPVAVTKAAPVQQVIQVVQQPTKERVVQVVQAPAKEHVTVVQAPTKQQVTYAAPKEEEKPAKVTVLPAITAQAQMQELAPVDDGYTQDTVLPAKTHYNYQTTKAHKTTTSKETFIQPVNVPQIMTRAHTSHSRIIQPIINQEVIQPIIEKQPIIKEQTIEQPILQPQLTETYQAEAPEMVQTTQTAKPQVNQPVVQELKPQVQQLPTIQAQPITQPMQMTQAKKH